MPRRSMLKVRIWGCPLAHGALDQRHHVCKAFAMERSALLQCISDLPKGLGVGRVDSSPHRAVLEGCTGHRGVALMEGRLCSASGPSATRSNSPSTLPVTPTWTKIAV